MTTNRIAIASLLVLGVLGLLVPDLAAQQACGVNVSGGTITSGFYSGTGSSCDAAKDDCKTDGVGITPPDCAGCPSGQAGCVGSANWNSSTMVFGTCHWDQVLGVYVVVGQVTQNQRWYKACSPCIANP